MQIKMVRTEIRDDPSRICDGRHAIKGEAVTRGLYHDRTVSRA
jgi:hypothetical protein